MFVYILGSLLIAKNSLLNITLNEWFYLILKLANIQDKNNFYATLTFIDLHAVNLLNKTLMKIIIPSKDYQVMQINNSQPTININISCL